MVIRLGKKLDAARIGESLEALNDFRAVRLELIQHDAGQRVRTAKAPLVDTNHVEDALIRGQVALRRHLATDFRVLVIVEIIVIGVEDRVPAQSEWLVNLKIKANRSHGYLALRRAAIA